MSWRFLLRPDVQDYIKRHENDDVRVLALKKRPDPSWNASLVLDQIKVRQNAKDKSPEWHDTDGIIFPSSHDFEQSSSRPCALYKASLVEGNKFADLSAGTGIDSYYFSKRFGSGVCVEKSKGSSEILEHNMAALHRAGKLSAAVKVLCSEAEAFVKTMEYIDFAYIDPQRRDESRKGIYRLSDGSPDIGRFLPDLKEKTGLIMIKASPRLDIHQAIETLGPVKAVHVVQWDGDCKEVLYVLEGRRPDHSMQDRGSETGGSLVTAVQIDDEGQPVVTFSYRIQDEKDVRIEYAMPEKYIYEPGPAFQKAGGFKNIAVHYGVKKLHPHTHLYTSENPVEGFPGKRHEILDIVSPKSGFAGFHKAEIALRNFPGTEKDLRKRLKLSDGGDRRIYACTLANGEKRLIVCKKEQF